MSKEIKIPKISVILICYNQEDVIARALNSVLCQKEYLYELIVADDCSKDKTWDIVNAYQQNHTGVIKAFRNEKNLGVYGNLQSTFRRVTGELVFRLGGDDELGKELFKHTCEVLANAGLDYSKDRFCLLTDFKQVAPSGHELIIRNNLFPKHKPFALKLRELIFNRELGESITAFKKRIPLDIDAVYHEGVPSSLQEGYIDLLPYVNSDRFFYIPYIGNIYYTGLGISKKIQKQKKKRLESMIEYCEKIPSYLNDVDLASSDFHWLEFQKSKSEFLLKPTVKKLWNYFGGLLLLFRDPLCKYLLVRETKVFLRSALLLTGRREN